MSAPQKVLDLIEVFDRNTDDYRSARFNEAMLRQQFVNPLFKCLGWDMDNEQGYAEAYKDVIHEAAVRVGGATKAPDYSFRIGGTPKFFLEAKKPSVNVKDDPAPAFQLRRYAWSARMPLSVLTNFQEFAVYDCRVKPAQTDKASAARIVYLRCADFAAAWDEKIAGVFSREAVLKGSFDKFAESKKAKRGTAAVDAAFLDEIENWREQLAKNLALRNPELTSRELNFAVQVTIDRIIFLRMCEDRGVESYGQLLALQNGAAVYGRLKELFQKADERYNSGLFHFHKEKDRAEAPDELTPQLQIDDLVLKSIFRGLYYPDSPYEFSVLPVEILGHVYEQFLGKVIRLTAAHQAKVEEKLEVKKAGGVYYTPSYIVDYIVQNTVGRLLEGKTPKEAARLTVLDPACGSGSFLVGAYRRLLEWHLKQYEEDGPEKHTKEVFQAAGGVWRLTTAEKKRILLSNIYGVDIDPQAVEVTKLSLLLKVLEGESQETIETQRKRYNERALPDLAGNIKCGNSLIGPDFYEGRQSALLDEEERYRINVFDWNAAFPKIMKTGGFNAVIGNPPYIQLSMEAFRNEAVNAYLKETYKISGGRLNTFVFFIELARLRAREGGRAGYIVPNTILSQEYYEGLRRNLIQNTDLNAIAIPDGTIFKGAVVETVVVVFTKHTRKSNEIPDEEAEEVEFLKVGEQGPGKERARVRQGELAGNYKASFITPLRPELREIRERLEKCTSRFGTWLNLNQAIALKHDRAACLSERRETEAHREVLDGRHITRYATGSSTNYFKFDLSKIHSCKREDIFLLPEKIVFRRVGASLIASLDTEKKFALNTLVVMSPKPECPYAIRYVLGLFNSRLLNFYYVTYLKSTKTVFSEIQARQVEQLPLPNLVLTKATDKTKHDGMVQLVEQMLALHKQLAAANAPHDKTVLQAQIDATDRRIDRLVYDLYGLTEEEIRIVEPSGG